jgi:hypothetical protein
MSLYLTQLAAMGGPKLEWIQARVFSIIGGDITLTYGNGQIRFAACLASYTPVAGDYVHCLSLEGQGVLILGKASATGSTPPPEIAQAPVVYTPVSLATWDATFNTWVPDTLLQGPTTTGIWFYSPTTFASMAGKTIQKAELEVTRTSGGPLEITPHLISNTTGGLVLSDDPPILPTDPAANVATWVPIPLGWATDLVNGTIKGFAITASYEQTGVYSGGGRVRLTPLSVTI